MPNTLPMLFTQSMISDLFNGGRVVRVPVKFPVDYSDLSGFRFSDKNGKKWACGKGVDVQQTEQNLVSAKSPIKQGDLIWVRETFCMGRYEEEDAEHPDDRTLYIDDSQDEHQYVIYKHRAVVDGADIDGATWSPSVHMRKALSRLTLLVTHVGIEKSEDTGNYSWVVQFEIIEKNISQVNNS